MKKIKFIAKHIMYVLIGLLYAPIFIAFWALLYVSRFVLAISHYGTLNATMGNRIMASLFSKKYEQNI